MRLIPIECVKEGSFLAKTIFDNDGRVLLREGIKLNELFIRRIQLIGIQSLYINDEYSEKEIEDIIKPELRQKAIKAIKETFSNFEKTAVSSANNGFKSPAAANTTKQRDSYFQSIGDLTNQIMEELLSRKNVLINIVDIKSMDNYTYQHSVNVAVLSLILGMNLQLSRYELYDLCMGALVHDIGKVLIPKQIIQKKDILTREEFAIIKEHSLKGYDYLKGSLDISAPSRIVALQHHERMDGKGYPDGRIGTDINKLARIVAIADVYDALTSDRPYRKAMSPNDAVEYIMACGGSHFDYQMVKVFAKTVVPYPEGTLVKLSNSDVGVVEETMPNYPLRPKVKVVKSLNAERLNLKCDLIQELNLVITGVEYNV